MFRAAFAACLAAAANVASASDVDVAIANFQFLPSEPTVKAGARLVFVNRDAVPHSVVGSVGHEETFRSNEQLDEGESFAVVLDAPGEFDIRCGVHSAMKGKVRVTP